MVTAIYRDILHRRPTGSRQWGYFGLKGVIRISIHEHSNRASDPKRTSQSAAEASKGSAVLKIESRLLGCSCQKVRSRELGCSTSTRAERGRSSNPDDARARNHSTCSSAWAGSNQAG